MRTLKNDRLRDTEREGLVAEVLGAPPTSDIFHRLVECGKRIYDFEGEDEGEDPAGDGRMAEAEDGLDEAGVAVVFDEEEESSEEEGDDEDDEENEDEDDEGQRLMSTAVEERREEKGHDVVSAADVDAFWLQRKVKQYEGDADLSQELSEKILR